MSRTYRDTDEANPEHYRKDGVECIDAMPEHMAQWLNQHWDEILPPAEMIHPLERATWLKVATRFMLLGFCLGNAFKYRWRIGLKESEPTEREHKKIAWFDAMALHVLNPKMHVDPRDDP